MSVGPLNVLDAVAARLAGLGLTLAGAVVPVSVAKQPHQQEGQTQATQLTVCAAPRARESRRWTYLHQREDFGVLVVLWTPGNRDRTANFADLSAIEAAVNDAFDSKPADLMGLDGLRDCKADTNVFLDRGAYLQGWDASVTLVTVSIVRVR